MTVATPDVSGIMKALSGVRVTVYTRDTTNAVKVYRNHDGTTQGPTAESGASGGPNPFLTGPGGMIEFWCDGPAELDVLIEDTQAPARVATRTVGWNCMPTAPGSIPTSMLAGDAALDLDALGPEILRQVHQIGEVIEWWRPASSVPLPAGFEVCDGHQVPAGQHDFPGLSTSAINLPDLRNAFILGADPNKAFAAGANQGDAASDAPGIGGSGGSNAAKNFAHIHGVPGVSHTHSVTYGAHQHGPGSLYAASHGHAVNISTGTPNEGTISRATGTGTVAPPSHTHNVNGSTGASGSLGIGGATDPGGGGTVNTSATTPGATNTNSQTWTSDPGSDMRPRWVGLLKLMKVRRS